MDQKIRIIDFGGSVPFTPDALAVSDALIEKLWQVLKEAHKDADDDDAPELVLASIDALIHVVGNFIVSTCRHSPNYVTGQFCAAVTHFVKEEAKKIDNDDSSS